MAYLDKHNDLNTVTFTYATTDANVAATSSAVFTGEAHLHSAFPDHDFISRDKWDTTAVSMYLQDGSGNPTVSAFKGRVFISLDAKVWFKWVEMENANITVVDMPFSFIKVVRDNTTAGTVKVVIRSALTHTA